MNTEIGFWSSPRRPQKKKQNKKEKVLVTLKHLKHQSSILLLLHYKLKYILSWAAFKQS